MKQLEVSPTALAAVRSVLAQHNRPGWKPTVSLTLGTGFGGLAELVQDPIKVPYSKLWPKVTSTVEGHSKELVIGKLFEVETIVFSGRIHGYEGYEPDVVTQSMLLAKALGAKTAILTNAAGALNTDLKKGQLMVISDHINLTGRSPLRGKNDDKLGTRFPGQQSLYGTFKDLLRQTGEEFKHTSGHEAINGVYVGVNGPEFETPAEVKMLRTLGGDAVGMSTVHEAIVANWLGLSLIGLSLIANATGNAHEGGNVTHIEVQEAGREAATRVIKFMKILFRGYPAAAEAKLTK